MDTVFLVGYMDMASVEAEADDPERGLDALETAASPQCGQIARSYTEELVAGMKAEAEETYLELFSDEHPDEGSVQFRWDESDWVFPKEEHSPVIRAKVFTLYEGEEIVGMGVIQERPVN